jgi:7-keto-8-aminopelargonate synthetase-like enzyme
MSFEKVGDPLAGSLVDHLGVSGANLLTRVDPFWKWVELRKDHEVWPYTRAHTSAPTHHCTIEDQRGLPSSGVNFASQDYLSLASHEEIKLAATSAIQTFGVHSAGSSALLGGTLMSRRLERELSELLQTDHVLLYPTGWAAGFGAIAGLVRREDWVVLDKLAHACLQTGAAAATPKVSKFAHNDLVALERELRRIRASDVDNAILVVTEGLFSMDSDSPDIRAMSELCKMFGATLMLDVAHDLGAMGLDGTGMLGIQAMLGQVDLVMGSFSKTFASNGGFVACKSPAVIEYLRSYSSPQTFSNALSPVQAAVICKALEIVRGDEGQRLRERLMRNILALRAALEREGLSVLGAPSPIVPVVGGSEGMLRVASRQLRRLGVHANLVEYPAVSRGTARFRMQVMAAHSVEDAECAAKAIALAIAQARLDIERASVVL